MSQSPDDTIHVITDDKTHFPMLEIENIGFFTLWPITKIQFEMYMSEVNRLGDRWYDEILSCNPRVSYRQVNKTNYEQLFITGLHIEEVHSFSEWFGKDFRIPTVQEWREVYRLMDNLPCFEPPADMSYPANQIWKKLIKISTPPIKFSMMKDGVVDWVSQGNSYVGIGAPRNGFYQAAWNPLTDTVKKIKPDERLNYLGFRLIREGKS
jgi:hypothetical protein